MPTEENGVPTVRGRRLHFDRPIFDDAGEAPGTIRGFDEGGFYVRTPSPVELRDKHRNDRPGAFDLRWRCWSCGELGAIEDFPETCPSCGAPKEAL